LDTYLPSANKEYYETWNDLLDVLNLAVKALTSTPQETMENDLEGKLDAEESDEILQKLLMVTDYEKSTIDREIIHDTIKDVTRIIRNSMKKLSDLVMPQHVLSIERCWKSMICLMDSILATHAREHQMLREDHKVQLAVSYKNGEESTNNVVLQWQKKVDDSKGA